MRVLKHAIDFASDAAGLEKTMRLIQALCQIFAFYPRALEVLLMGLGLGMGRVGEKGDRVKIVEGLWRARREVAVGRRYMRFFRFIENFSKAWEILCNEDGIRMMIGVGKSGFMGAYLGLESLTILDTMGICSTPWSSTCILEGNKFWFYSLCISIFGGLFELFILHCPDHIDHSNPSNLSKQLSIENANSNSHDDSTPTYQNTEDETSKAYSNSNSAPSPDSEEKKREVKKQTVGRSRTRILLKIIENAADLFVPGTVTGWIVTDAGVVGLATVVSTVLSSGEIWRRLADGPR